MLDIYGESIADGEKKSEKIPHSERKGQQFRFSALGFGSVSQFQPDLIMICAQLDTIVILV